MTIQNMVMWVWCSNNWNLQFGEGDVVSECFRDLRHLLIQVLGRHGGRATAAAAGGGVEVTGEAAGAGLAGHRAPGARPAVSEQQEAAHGEEAAGEAAVQPAEAQPRVTVTSVTGILTLLPRSQWVVVLQKLWLGAETKHSG